MMRRVLPTVPESGLLLPVVSSLSLMMSATLLSQCFLLSVLQDKKLDQQFEQNTKSLLFPSVSGPDEASVVV